MRNNSYRWEILSKTKDQKQMTKSQDIVDILLRNRGIKSRKEKDEFINPTPPEKLTLKSLSISEKEIEKAIKRIEKAIKNSEEIIIYGDYDADGVCATAILWECLYSLTKNVKPYIPSRFEEGYGLNAESIQELKTKNEKLKVIITVDNGISANEAVDKANELGIDVIITDHHQKGKKLPQAHSVIHTDKICGSGVTWVFSREVLTQLPTAGYQLQRSLDLAAIGTISDQMPLIGPNRSFAKYGLEELNITKRPGLLALFSEAGLDDGRTRLRDTSARQVGTYEVNFIIAPRINAMGRLEHAIDSLRLLCTTSLEKGEMLALHLAKINKDRQKIVDEVVLHAKELAGSKTWQGAIVVAHESYHEGVIGLAAAKLVEEYYRPAIVLSMGEKVSKASARSISGFNIIESIRELDKIILGGGGHPMAAGFSIETEKIELFIAKYTELSAKLLSDEILTKKLKIDLELKFIQLDYELLEQLQKFEPTGIGNPTPVFSSKDVKVISAKTVGTDGSHLKLELEKDGKKINAIAFGKGEILPKLSSQKVIDVVYNLTENTWNGNKSLQLKVKDIKLS